MGWVVLSIRQSLESLGDGHVHVGYLDDLNKGG